jgi:hypothetical protein
MKKLILAMSFLFASASMTTLNAQCDSIANMCAKHIIASFISDGQQYRSLLLNSEEYAEFHTTFFGETTYRIAACSGRSDGNLIFNIYDQDRRLLFSNRDQKNAPYWDFKVKSTVETIIEAQLDVNKNAGSGCAVILIGFKQK